MASPVLVADIGATHARFALAAENGLVSPAIRLPTAQFCNLSDAALEGLSLLRKSLPLEANLTQASIAVAGPVTGDDFDLTNAGWRFSIEATRRELGLERLLLLNDFEALAWSVPGLKPHDIETLRGGNEDARAPIAVIGPGTGLGVGALVPVGRSWKSIAGEGGIATSPLPPNENGGSSSVSRRASVTSRPSARSAAPAWSSYTGRSASSPGRGPRRSRRPRSASAPGAATIPRRSRRRGSSRSGSAPSPATSC